MHCLVKRMTSLLGTYAYSTEPPVIAARHSDTLCFNAPPNSRSEWLTDVDRPSDLDISINIRTLNFTAANGRSKARPRSKVNGQRSKVQAFRRLLLYPL